MTIDTTIAREMLVKELKLEGFTAEEQKEIIDLLEENIVIKVNNDIFNLLEEADRDMFLQVCETNDNELIGKFLESKIHDLQGLVKRAAEYIIRDFKSLTS